MKKMLIAALISLNMYNSFITCYPSIDDWYEIIYEIFAIEKITLSMRKINWIWENLGEVEHFPKTPILSQKVKQKCSQIKGKSKKKTRVSVLTGAALSSVYTQWRRRALTGRTSWQELVNWRAKPKSSM